MCGITVQEAEKRRREAEQKYGKKAITEAKRVELYEALGLSAKEARLAASAETKILSQLESDQDRREAQRINQRIAGLKSGELKPLTDEEAARFKQVFNLSEAELAIFLGR